MSHHHLTVILNSLEWKGYADLQIEAQGLNILKLGAYFDTGVNLKGS